MTMHDAILSFSAEAERKFALLPADIAAEYDHEFSDLIEKLNDAQNAISALDPAFRRAGLTPLQAEED